MHPQGRPSREVDAVARYQRKDHYHQRAKREGLRSRAAYKLADLQREHGVLRPGQKIVDLGCWPGGWLQEAARIVGPRGRVVGVDLQALDPPLNNENVVAFVGDLTDAAVGEQILKLLGGPCDVLLSDAAPKLTGIRERDRAAEEDLLEAIERLIPLLLRPGGDLIVKILEGPEAQRVDRRLRALFERARSLRSPVTRKGSSERYLLGRRRLGDARTRNPGSPVAVPDPTAAAPARSGVKPRERH